MKKFMRLSFVIVTLLCSVQIQAQSLKDILNKENLEKAVSVVTGKNTASVIGTWSFTGAALEFESDNLLQKAGGSVAATIIRKTKCSCIPKRIVSSTKTKRTSEFPLLWQDMRKAPEQYIPMPFSNTML